MFKGKPITAIEADIASLEKRRASLEARQTKAATAVLNATGARRVLLTESDDPDPKALDAADRAVREAEGARDGAADALREIESRLVDARDRLARLQASEERERQAAAIEASATAADKAIDRIRKATAEIDRARADLAAAILPEAAICYAPPVNSLDWGPSYLTTTLFFDHNGNPTHDSLDTEQVAARIVGHLVSTTLPGLGIARLEDVTKMHAGGGSTHVLAPADGDVARSLLTDPMRSVAARVRSGKGVTKTSANAAARRRADRWVTDADGTSTDPEGKLVDGLGFYVNQEDAPALAPASAPTATFTREQIRPGVELLRPLATEAA